MVLGGNGPLMVVREWFVGKLRRGGACRSSLPAIGRGAHMFSVRMLFFSFCTICRLACPSDFIEIYTWMGRMAMPCTCGALLRPANYPRDYPARSSPP